MEDNISLFNNLLDSIEERKEEYTSNAFNEEIIKIKAIIYELENNQFFTLLSNEEIGEITKILFESIGGNLLNKFNSLDNQQKKIIDKKYFDESFWETIERVYTKYKYQPNIVYLEYPKSENMEEFIQCFKGLDKETTITFLDEVPIEDREEIIIDILKWGQKYYRGKIFTKKVTDKRKINSDIKQFNNTHQFIESFLPKKTSEKSHTKKLDNKTLTTTYVDFEGIPSTNISLLEDITKKLTELKNDLKNRDFKIFPREYYFDTKLPTKKKLEKIFLDIAKRYNLKGIKQIENFLPLIPNP